MDRTEFGRLLTKLRQQHNMTQSDLADALGVSISAVSKWENGKNYPDIPIFTELKNLFRLSYDDLYHPKQTLKRMEQPEDLTTPPEESKPKYGLQKKVIRGSILSLLLITCILFFVLKGVFADETAPPVGSPEFEVFSSTILHDETIHWDVHEIVLLYHGDELVKSKWYDEFAIRSKAWWDENELTTSVKCLKITTYTNPEDASSHAPTDYVGYSYRYTTFK